MIDFEFIERLIRALDESSVDSLEIERGGTKVRLSKTPPMTAAPVMPAVAPPAAPAAPGAPSQNTPPPASAPAQAEESAEEGVASSDLEEITSPMVGTFYRAPAPDAPPYVEEGSRITPGDTLCIIEAMKLMNELDAEISGRIVEILVENAQPVEFGQVLFRVDPS